MSNAIVESVFQSYDQNILVGSTLTANVAVSSGYDLQDVLALRPDYRIEWGVSTVTLHWHLAAAVRADILTIPMSNLTTGAAVLSNALGSAWPLTFPSSGRNLIPRTMVLDLTTLYPTNADRTDDDWYLTITTNPTNVVLGGCIALYSPRTKLTGRGFRWAYSANLQGGIWETENEYLSKFIQSTGTSRRELELTVESTTTDADALDGWAEGNNVSGRPALLWLYPTVNDALFGHMQKMHKREFTYLNLNRQSLVFTELSKGLPI